MKAKAVGPAWIELGSQVVHLGAAVVKWGAAAGWSWEGVVMPPSADQLEQTPADVRDRLEQILAEATSIGRAVNRLMAEIPGHPDAEAIGISAAQLRLHARRALRHLEAAEG